MRIGGHHAVEHHVHLAADQIGDGLRPTLVRHIAPLDAAALRISHARQMRSAAHARGHGVIEFAFLRLGIRHQFGGGVGWHFAADSQQVGRISHHGHWRKVIHHIER